MAKTKAKKKLKEVHSHHVQPTEHQGALKTRHVVSGADTGVGLGRHVMSDVADVTPSNAEQEPQKMALFNTQESAGNGDNVPAPGVSGRDFNPDPNGTE